LNVGLERPGPGEAEASVEDDLKRAVGPTLMVMAVLMISLSAEIFCPLTVTPRGGGVIPAPQQKEVLAMFANRQTPPGIAL
jgi:hypothetical protein